MPEWNKKLVECVEYLKKQSKANRFVSDGEPNGSGVKDEQRREMVHVELNDTVLNGEPNNSKQSQELILL